LERKWCIACQQGGNYIALGYDEEGSVAIQLDCENPAVSMDATGKIIWVKNTEIQTTNSKKSIVKDVDRLALPIKDLESCEIYPKSLQHSPNGRFVSVCGDGEYIIYTSLTWRNKSSGTGMFFFFFFFFFQTDKATAQWKFNLVEEYLLNTKDFNELLLFYTSCSNKQGLRTVADQARRFILTSKVYSLLTNHGS
ncbi:hypothetical protein K501DRAFT_180675, partial [Backusella circina FSU 941]